MIGLNPESVAEFMLESWAKGLKGELTLSHVEDTRSPRKYIGLSSAGQCRRQVGLTYRSDFWGDPLPTSVRHMFHDGNLLETSTVTVLKAGGCRVTNSQKSVRAEPVADMGRDEADPAPLLVQGHIDGLVRLTQGENGLEETMDPFQAADVYLWEHKTLRDYPWRLLIGKTGFKRDAPMKNVAREHWDNFILESGTVEREKTDNYLQMQAYMWSLAKNFAIQCAGGIYFGRSREANQVAVEIVRPDWTVGEEVNHDMDELAKQVIVDGLIPGRDYNPDSDKDWQCRFCRYRDHCVRLGKGPDAMSSDGMVEGPMPLPDGYPTDGGDSEMGEADVHEG